jgi:hypothetical protein
VTKLWGGQPTNPGPFSGKGKRFVCSQSV